MGKLYDVVILRVEIEFPRTFLLRPLLSVSPRPGLEARSLDPKYNELTNRQLNLHLTTEI